jgi:flagellin FlaB
MRGKLKGLIEALNRERNGITGLETAIILIAFVVVASVFAYTVLAAGVFASQKTSEAVYSGMANTGSLMQFSGSIIGIGNTTNNDVDELVFNVGNALGSQAISVDWTNPVDNVINATGLPGQDYLPDSTSTHVTTIGVRTPNEVVFDVMYTATPKGWGDGDQVMETGENFEIVVDLRGLSSTISPYMGLTFEVTPPVGAVIRVKKTIPADIEAVMMLH